VPHVPEPEARAVDDDPVLRALGEDLARDDPDLAARLTGEPGTLGAPPGRGALWVLVLGAVVLVAAPLLLGPAAFGLMALVVLIGCPFALSCWLPVGEWWPDDDLPS
jgi:uncharacterized RDD family membrane protein YckC